MRGWAAEGGGQKKEGRAGGRRDGREKEEKSRPTGISKSRRLFSEYTELCKRIRHEYTRCSCVRNNRRESNSVADWLLEFSK